MGRMATVTLVITLQPTKIPSIHRRPIEDRPPLDRPAGLRLPVRLPIEVASTVLRLEVSTTNTSQLHSNISNTNNNGSSNRHAVRTILPSVDLARYIIKVQA